MRRPRLGVIIPRKVVSRAVQRNGLKRLIKEVFRLQKKTYGNYDLVVRLKKYNDESRQELQMEITQLLLKSAT